MILCHHNIFKLCYNKDSPLAFTFRSGYLDCLLNDMSGCFLISLVVSREQLGAGHSLGCGDGVFDGDVQGTSFG